MNKKDRFATLDLLLVFSASCVIALAVWPRGSERRQFTLETKTGDHVVRSLPCDGALMQKIERRVEAIVRYNKSPAVALVAWNQELKNFYQAHPAKSRCCDNKESCEQESCSAEPCEEKCDDGNDQPTELPPTTASISDEIITASFDGSSDKSANPTNVETAGHFSELEKDSSNVVQAQATLPTIALPIVLGKTATPGKPSFAFHFALMIGVLFACGYKFWHARTPHVRGTKNQPVSVKMRQYTLISGTCLAIFAAILMTL